MLEGEHEGEDEGETRPPPPLPCVVITTSGSGAGGGNRPMVDDEHEGEDKSDNRLTPPPPCVVITIWRSPAVRVEGVLARDNARAATSSASVAIILAGELTCLSRLVTLARCTRSSSRGSSRLVGTSACRLLNRLL